MSDLSIILRCSNDIGILDTIKSTDCHAEIICSLTPNKYIEEQLDLLHIKYIITDKPNLSVQTNKALEICTHEKVIISDSDTIFKSGALSLISRDLNTYDVVNCKLIFDKNERLFSNLISKLRTFDDVCDGDVHTPGMALNKSIIHKIGGYWFDSSLSFNQDSDLSRRIKKENISIFHTEYDCLLHKPTKLTHFLLSNYKHGLYGYLINYREKLGLYSIIKRDVEIQRFFDIYRYGGLNLLFFAVINDTLTIVGKLNMALYLLIKKMIPLK